MFTSTTSVTSDVDVADDDAAQDVVATAGTEPLAVEQGTASGGGLAGGSGGSAGGSDADHHQTEHSEQRCELPQHIHSS